MNWLLLAFALLPIDEPPAVFPVLPPAVVVDQVPPSPRPVDTLAANEVLVLALTQRIALIAVPEGLVEIEETQQAPGPRRLFAASFPAVAGSWSEGGLRPPFCTRLRQNRQALSS